MSQNSIGHDQLIDLFDRTFLNQFHTRLRSGFDEPLYTPASESKLAEVCFRADYVSSGLHEIAHWCIAGDCRRKLVDYGYWYEPDGRNHQKQLEFERVEVKPQALEWLFSVAAGVDFHISADNLALNACSKDFAEAVVRQVQIFFKEGMPQRAELFYKVLTQNEEFGCKPCIDNFCMESLI